MIIATALNLLHFREKNRQVPATYVDLAIRDSAGGKQVLDGLAAAQPSVVTPMRCGSCAMKMRIARALTKPTMTLRGMNLISLAAGDVDRQRAREGLTGSIH